jgi:hypothetical protein
MKKLILPAMLAIALFSCGKKNKFECDLQMVDKPANDSARLFIPTAFSPNGDGLNDRFFIQTADMKSIHWEVYNHDNEMLFSTSSLTEYWAPSMSFPDGLTLYYYKLEAVTKAGNKISRCGDLYAYTCMPKGFSIENIIFGDQYDPAAPEGYLHGTSAENFTQCKD